MEIIKKGTVEKIDGGYMVRGYFVDCEGKKLNLKKFLKMIGIPPNSRVQINDLDMENPTSKVGIIAMMPPKQ